MGHWIEINRAPVTVNRLLCAGWIPHFRLFVWGCLSLGSGVEACRPHSSLEGSPSRALPPTLCNSDLCGVCCFRPLRSRYTLSV